MGNELKIKKLWFADNKIFIGTNEGKELWQSLLWYPRLRFASDKQRNNYRISYSGIHWADIDEDISFESFFYAEPEPVGIARIFREYPEINVSAFARRMGIQQSLIAAYMNGTKKPSVNRLKKIENEIHKFADELKKAQFN